MEAHGRLENEIGRLPWLERPSRELIRLAWPIAVSFLSYSTMSLVDTLFVAQLGPAALAGVGLGTTSSFALLCFAFGMLRGVKVQVSQSIGAGRRDEADAFLGGGLILGLALGCAVLVVGLGFAQVLPLLSATVEAGDHARSYFQLRILAAPALLAYVALREYRYGIGDSRWPMVASVVANVANVLLDWLFIFGFQWGVEGAALATVTGHVIEALVLVAHQLRLGRSRRAEWRHVRGIVRVGLATGIQFLLEMGSFTALSFLIASMSDIQMAAHQIAIQVIHFTFLPALSIAEAASVLAGQAVGAGRDEQVRRVAVRALGLAGSYSLACTLLLGLFGSHVAANFADDPLLIRTASHLLWIAMWFQLADASGMVASATLRGTGDVRFTALVGTLSAWSLTPPLTLLLGYELGWGAAGGWTGLCFEIALASSLYWTRLLRNGWKPAAQQNRMMLASAEPEPAASTVAAAE